MATQPTKNTGAPQVTSASAWKKQTSAGTPLVVPSGNTCLVRTPGMQVFVRRGMIPNSLMPIVQEAIQKGKPPSNKALNLEQTPEMLEEMMEVMDNVTIYCVVEPKVAPAPADDEERDENILYVDEVDFMDKLFIFQYAVGGTADLEKFRKESGFDMGAVSAG